MNESGKAYNYLTNNELSPTKSGYIILSGKSYNLAKLMLETFKKIPVRNGSVLFINNDKSNFHFNNLAYLTGHLYNAPNEIELINCIRLYFEVPKKLNRHNIMFKYYLDEIVQKRGFIDRFCKESDFFLFREWLKPFYCSKSKVQISKDNSFNVTNGTSIINKYLCKLVCECLEDQQNGLLNTKDFEKKPITKTQEKINLNRQLKEMGFDVQIPLRKQSF